ncbi:MAG TPA: hemolysin family protein [Bryobacteraceae bacterium]|nr:hemolysin family protein [Bryobacteraceae bacterium]
MEGISLEVALILLLVIANGVFSMAEMAVVSARKARLRQRADDGSKGARVALALASNPNDFLSTVQIGITMIGTLAGAFGGATIAEKLSVYLKQWAWIAPYSDSVSITIVVLIISYLSLVLGELVPKALALSNAEGIASGVAPPMQALSRAGAPLVRVLTFSTEIILKVLPIRKSVDVPVTEDEIKQLIAQGTEHGTFEEAEQEMVSGVFRLGDRKAAELMRPRNKICWLDVTEDWPAHEAEIAANPYSRYLVADGELDKVLGVIHVKDILLASLGGGGIDLRKLARKPLFVPETTPALHVLERFQETGEQMAVVIDEHGMLQGIVTMADFVESVVGVVRNPGEEGRPDVVHREDGSWLVDGALPYADLLEELAIRQLPVKHGSFTTVGGLVLSELRRIPSSGDHCFVGDYRFEVLDMDGNRIDKVLVQRVEESISI